ncbi:bifunctional protein tyrosine phosphatase family protein/NAD(P)/FAD-dependent oxidoreductase [Rubrimonas cliftonensis]|uniref:Sulfide:quinone oxidoreductase n=1 Tax=Rubrimonas cliftonensis TaxID=89524 RepID=A0A1H3ZK74_9RHOB|nr:bifunctional protein tyrosine phosphatase family protein/NAD(P)/FAD-dependent oxidoreductase [Rubrimonas cliftonensis]SEA23664.1 sulfide:quinone oxidoreductase [Rubrimonas cliftonensis]
MDIRRIAPDFWASPQIAPEDVGVAVAQGARAIVCNRPDGESEDQPATAAIRAAAEAHGLPFRAIPVKPGQIGEQDVAAFRAALDELEGPVLAFCRTGSRSATLWGLAKAPRLSADAILQAAGGVGYDLAPLRPRLEASRGDVIALAPAARHDVVIVGGGAGGISTAASLLKRNPKLDIAIVEPRAEHYYQPGWTLVGGGVFNRAETMRPMAEVMPAGVKWVRTAAAAFAPEKSQVVLEDGTRLGYRALVLSPGLHLDWDAIDGLRETLGANGVTSNYMFDLAPYTWELTQGLRSGRAIFTQPPMPIKCAGAPQKAMYLSADHWTREGRIGDVQIEFCNAGGVLFGVADYVPALMEYIRKYEVRLGLNERLVAVDGPARTATFAVKDGDAEHMVEKPFDMLHVTPPQRPTDLMRASPFGDAAGWVEVNHQTLQHVRYGDVFGLGDGCSAPNAKTAAAVRKQAPVVAENIVAMLKGEALRAVYDGYGSCPLTVERGRIVLAEFLYGGKVQPSLPTWLIDGRRPSRLAWLLKERMLPWLYWNGMFKAREWLARPTLLPMTPKAHEALPACETGAARAS